VVGDANTNQRKYYDDCLAQAGPTVTFLPYTAGDELKQLLRTYHTLLIPSHFETFSLVGWEAAAQGMQVLYNDVADMSETLAPIGTALQLKNQAEAQESIDAALQENVEQKKSHDLLESRSWDTIILALLEAYA